jgi:hypothetical protein
MGWRKPGALPRISKDAASKRIDPPGITALPGIRGAAHRGHPEIWEGFFATTTVRKTRMPLVFENDVYFDPMTDDAIIWADEGTKRFRLVIPRSVLVDKYGLKQYFDHPGAEAIIQKNRKTFEKIAQDAHDVGASEVTVA